MLIAQISNPNNVSIFITLKSSKPFHVSSAMSLISQTLLTNPKTHIKNTHHFNSLKKINPYPQNLLSHFNVVRSWSPNLKLSTSINTNSLRKTRFVPVESVRRDAVYNTNDLKLDTFLAVAEYLCLGSSLIVAVGYAVSCAVSGTRNVVVYQLGSRVLVWLVVALVTGVVTGNLIRSRQWSRICVEKRGVESVSLIGRIEKLEEDLRSSAGLIRAMSRQIEKLGIRFRVTRKSLKEPIAQSAALAQKNSEATRALAVQEDNLEKELGEIQNVLLAMQEQQQKQLELILAIAKASNLFDNRQRQPAKAEETVEPHEAADKRLGPNGLPLTQTGFDNDHV